MQIPDLVKLVYQGEFAGGHQAEDSVTSEKRIAEERLAATAARASAFAFEDIGGGLCRLYLNAPETSDYRDATVSRFFINTARTVRGEAARFEGKLTVMLQCCREGLLPFDAEEASVYIAKLKAAGYPPVSHSAQYRKAYAPAYLVVGAQYRDFAEVFHRIDGLIGRGGPVLVAIDGGSASGKSTLAALIAGVYDAALFHMDDYFLPPERKTPRRLAEPGGNVDYERFDREVMAGLRGGSEFLYRVYDCKTGMLGAPVAAQTRAVNIIEGAYSLHPILYSAYDLKIFLDIDAGEQSRRIQKRNGEVMHMRFMQEWVPLENRYFEALDIRRRCDIVYHAPCEAE